MTKLDMERVSRIKQYIAALHRITQQQYEDLCAALELKIEPIEDMPPAAACEIGD